MTLSILAATGFLAVIVTMLYVGGRLETIEDRLSFEPVSLSAGQVSSVTSTDQGRAVYVPAYSHMYSRGGQAFLLESP